VIVGALLLGRRRGIALGAVFGLSSLCLAVFLPLTPMDRLFADPLVSVLPRMCIGESVPFAVRLFLRAPGGSGPARLALCTGAAAAVGSITNTVGVLAMVALRYPAEFDDLPLDLFRFIAVNSLTETALAVPAAVFCVPFLQKLLDVPFGYRLRDVIQIRLFFLVTLAFFVTCGIAYVMLTRQAREKADEALQRELLYLRGQIEENNKLLQNLEEMTGKNLLERAYAVAFIVRENPVILGNPDLLEPIRERLGLEAIALSDEQGTVIAEIPDKTEVGVFNFFAHGTTAPYGRLITDRESFIIEKPRLSVGKLREYRQLAGVPRLDAPGIVQVAFSSSRYAEEAEAASVRNICNGYTIGRTGYAFISREGVVVSASDPRWLDRNAADAGWTASLLAREGNFFPAAINGENVFARYARFGEYALFAVLPEAEAYADRNALAFWNSLMYFFLFSAVFVAISVLLNANVIRNIHRINASLALIAAGDLEKRIDVRTSHEFSLLSEGLNAMVSALRDLIAKEAVRVDRELGLARKIQSSTLNTIFPPYPQRTEFALYAAMHAAREVGGDFYDFFLIDDDHLACVIADVSDKGIPAALFMMRAKTQIKNGLLLARPLGETIAAVNDRLCESNTENMFVTVFVSVLHIPTGRARLVNAGHTPPVLCRSGAPFDWLRPAPNLALGVTTGLYYQESEVELHPGDRLFWYTDGVTEAMDARNRFFGQERLLETLRAHEDATLEELLTAVKSAIDLFAGEAPQFDDIAMLALEYRGPAECSAPCETL
jgi:serine phosphatase RsbU (regulator of sigma subunit)/uncharacterized membrane protein